MPTIPLVELISDVDEILRRAEEGEEFTITMSGQPVAVLGPARKQWIDSSAFEELAKLPVDPGYMRDIEDFGFELRNPWEL